MNDRQSIQENNVGKSMPANAAYRQPARGVVYVYKYLLYWRYLRNKYIALAGVISVMLGVATMIVVSSVMAGFGEQMRDRRHGVPADVVVELMSLRGRR